jgi:hypothetical protein
MKRANILLAKFFCMNLCLLHAEVLGDELGSRDRQG